MTQRPSRFVGSKPKGSQTQVRVGALEDTLESYTSETGRRLSAWFAGVVHPILMDFEGRIAALELPWYKKLWLRFAARTRPDVVEAPAVSKDSPQPIKVAETVDPEPKKSPATPQRETRTCAKCGKLFIVHNQSRICPICVAKDGQ